MSLVPPVDTLLAIDIGNTRIGMAVSDADGIHDTQRVGGQQQDRWRAALEETWRATLGAGERGVVIGSVCPDRSRAMSALVDDVCGVPPRRIRDDLPLPMELDIDNPGEVGVDRICCAAAAYDRIRAACAVASFGTAITMDCVSGDGRFLGGAILPGLDACCAALHERTAALPRVSPAKPTGAIGRNTHDAIVSGVAYGAAGALREIVEQFAVELGEWPQVVITGGNAPLIAELAEFVDSIVPDLCLMGVALAYRRATAEQ
ncbi:MAG: type III pantothenate kinase [Planctomycetes bacterium]|nr:type III pantothenate kinase [Planctomycetota bacterium]